MSELSYMPDGTPVYELTADDPWGLEFLKALRERRGPADRDASELDQAIAEFQDYFDAEMLCCGDRAPAAPRLTLGPPQPPNHSLPKEGPLLETWYERVQAIRDRRGDAPAPGPYAEGIRAFRKALDSDRGR